MISQRFLNNVNCRSTISVEKSIISIKSIIKPIKFWNNNQFYVVNFNSLSQISLVVYI